MNKEPIIIYGDGIHDDTYALQEYLNGNRNIYYPDGRKFPDHSVSNDNHPDSNP